MRAKLINPLFERPMEDISYGDIVNKEYIDQLEMGQSMDYYVAQYVGEEEGKFFDPEEDPELTQEIMKSEDFKNWVQFELETRMDSFKEIISDLSEDNSIDVYRAMTVDDDYLEKLKYGQVNRLGIYWTYEEDKAEAHWGYNQEKTNEIILQIAIKEEYIDWVDTFRLNLEHEFMNDESEIRLFKNTPIQIKNIFWKGEGIEGKDLTQIQQHTFKA